MPTIYDVAKLAGVSTYTVSAVINRSAYVSPELTARVEQAVQQLDYTVNHMARSLQTRQTMNVGMLLPDVGNPFYAKVVRGAEDKLDEAGYRVIIGNTSNSGKEQNRYLELFRSGQIDGMLLFLASGDQSELKQLVSKKKPIVFLGRIPSFPADYVTADNVRGAELAVEYLISKGHQRIGIIIGQEDLSPSVQRVEGWRNTLTKKGLSSPEEYIATGDWGAESGYRCAQQLLKLEPRPSALFVANFMMMTGALRAVKDAGLRNPEDVRVASCDDAEWLDCFSPPVTTIEQPSYELGAEGAALLLARLQDPGREACHLVLQPKLKIRE